MRHSSLEAISLQGKRRRFQTNLTLMGISRHLTSPVRVACLALIVVAGYFMGVHNVPADAYSSAAYRNISDQMLAGRAFQYAAALAGFLSCGWSSAAILEDRNAFRLETLIASGQQAWRYVLLKLGGLLAVFLIPAALLVALSWGFRGFVAGAWTALPYLSACLVVYLPIVLFALCFGMCLGTITRSRLAPMIAFAVLWVGGMLYLPPEMHIFDVTGESLNTAFFNVPPEILNRADYLDAGSMFDEGLALYIQTRIFSRYNLVFLIAGIVLTSTILLIWINRKWRIDASALITTAVSRVPSIPLPQAMLWLRVMGVGKIYAFVLAVASTGAFMTLNSDQSFAGGILIESIVPLCAIFLYAGVYAKDARLGVEETALTLSNFYMPYLKRLLLASAVLCLILFLLSMGWHEAMGLDLSPAFLMGLAPSVLFGGIVFVLGVASRSEATATTASVALWVFLHFSEVAEAFMQFCLSWLYPFPFSMNISSAAASAERIPVLLVGIGLFFVGFLLLSRPERMVVKSSKTESRIVRK